ncbi:neuroligin-1-like [Tropilaelaps mercedesae]|uniref:Neuroligin-1-like n=1 Tax=Tropilaelaps mercedesae TaxID=418985 RepID=A0A1V9XQC3_9ACAR|nr:neuroligin-1-like [Tropilaelaps mercedesae]
MSLWNRLIPALHRPDAVDSNGSFTAIGNNSKGGGLGTSDSSSSRNRSNASSEGFGFPRGYSFSQGPFVFRLPLLVTIQSTSQAHQPTQPRRVAYDPVLLVPDSSVPSPPDQPSGSTEPILSPLDHFTLSLESLASGPHSKALFITIAVGCSLLVVNILVFAGTYYQHRADSEHQQRKTAPTSHRQRVKNVDDKMSTSYASHNSPIMFHLSLSEKTSQKSNPSEYVNGKVQLSTLDLYNLGHSEDRKLLAELTNVTAPSPQMTVSLAQEDSGPENEQLMRPLLESFNMRQANDTSEIRGDLGRMSTSVGHYEEPEYQNVIDTGQSPDIPNKNTGETTV